MSDMIVTTSSMGVKESVDRIEKMLSESDWIATEFPVIYRIDLGKYASKAKFTLQSELLMFDYPNMWGFLMDENPAIGIEWPLKVVAWQDEQGCTRVGYSNPKMLVERYKIKRHTFEIECIENLMENIIAGLTDDM